MSFDSYTSLILLILLSCQFLIMLWWVGDLFFAYLSGKVDTMSRSKKHTPITGNTTAETTRDYKRARAKTERSHERDLTKEAMKGDEKAQERLEVESAPWNEWECERDGKQWIGDLDDKEYKRKLMRK